MPRALRLYVPDILYHVFSRGNNRDPIFFEKGNYVRFLQNLERYRQIHRFKLFAYSLLPNHFHLILQAGPVPLSKIMQTMLTAYTMYLNKKYDRVGHVFQGRFQSIIIDKESYFLEVLRYTHLNAVRAGLTDTPDTHLWSSYRRYLYRDSLSIPKLEIKEVLAYYSEKPAKQIKQFHEFTLDGLKGRFDPFKEQTRGILGSTKFRQKITKVLKGIRP